MDTAFACGKIKDERTRVSAIGRLGLIQVHTAYTRPGLFSVPAPPFRLARAAGFFSLVRNPLPTCREACDSKWPRICGTLKTIRSACDFRPFSAVVDPLDPGAGLGGMQIDGRPIADARLLQVELNRVDAAEAGEHDSYVRGGDLVLSYSDRPGPNMPQIYWRARELGGQHPAIAAIELVASVQTSLLDSYPALAACSQLTAVEALRLADVERSTFVNAVRHSEQADAMAGVPHCYLLRLAAGPFSYAEMVQPFDTQQSRCDLDPSGRDARVQLRHRLFAERLEKGVILRARVLGVLLDRDGDEAAAANQYAAFLKEALPLTA